MVVANTSQALIEAAPDEVGMSSARLGNVSRLFQRYIDEEKLAGAISRAMK
jgi:hypothetical protein